MKNKTMTERELLVSTVKFYTSKNRSVNNDRGCFYRIEKEGVVKNCGIGRHLSKKACITFDKDADDTSIEYIFCDDNFKCLAPKWMQKMDVKFLADIQKLHDMTGYWYSEGLSDDGRSYVNEICKTYNLDPLTEEEFKHEESNI